mmetsp:Transcript_37317/g.107839  ORF Transcript_37317/g.107839 Transcript_37317/m.107839 type:complete len:260 (+) Transcript_37317:652-1431(+)
MAKHGAPKPRPLLRNQARLGRGRRWQLGQDGVGINEQVREHLARQGLPAERAQGRRLVRPSVRASPETTRAERVAALQHDGRGARRGARAKANGALRSFHRCSERRTIKRRQHRHGAASAIVAVISELRRQRQRRNHFRCVNLWLCWLGAARQNGRPSFAIKVGAGARARPRGGAVGRGVGVDVFRGQSVDEGGRHGVFFCRYVGGRHRRLRAWPCVVSSLQVRAHRVLRWQVAAGQDRGPSFAIEVSASGEPQDHGVA